MNFSDYFFYESLPLSIARATYALPLYALKAVSGVAVHRTIILLPRIPHAIRVCPILCEGMGSTVRRCIEKQTGSEFAAKIVDLTVLTFEEAQVNSTIRRTMLENNIIN
jgi:hypothetical protein